MILIINFGSQVTHLIGRRLRQLNVFSEIKPAAKITYDDIEQADGIILSGGPDSVNSNSFNPDLIFKSGKPILGLCYGHQLIAQHFGGKVANNDKRAYGCAKVILDNSDLFKNLDTTQTVWMSHADTVIHVPDRFETIAHSDGSCAAIAHKEKNIFGLQFHPEVEHTVHGKKILQNFIDICKITRSWQVADQKDEIIMRIRNEVQSEKVIMAISGGVDSTVAATLLHQAIQDNVFFIYVDTGLMRKDESEEVQNIFNGLGFKHVQVINAEDLFLSRLKNVTDPEEKRKIIGHTFIELFDQEVMRLQKEGHRISFLGQGTIYPDTVESAQASQSSAKIKSHHNVTLPEKMNLKLIEPLRTLYKDEVRELGEQLGISSDFLYRHPFPGPGLAVRILGPVDKDKVRIVQEADAIFISALKKSGYYQKVWQAFAALIPVHTVGVMGDNRTYEYMITLRAITSSDAMTADWAKLPEELLTSVANDIVNNVAGVNRVVYDITQKPPATIEYE